MPFFAVATAHGTWLSRPSGGTTLVHAAPGGAEVVLMFRPASAPGIGLLLAPSGVLALEGDPWRAAILPVRLSDDATALVHPATGLLFTAGLPEGGFGRIAADRTQQAPWERFTLQEVTVPASLAGFAAAVERLASCAASAEAMVALLDSGEAVTPDLLGALGRLLPLPELEGFARTLLQRPVARERLALLLPDDLWASRALPRLGRWLAMPDEVRHERRCGPELAVLAEAGASGLPQSFAQAVNAAARRLVAPRRQLCAVAAVRDCGPLLLEWVAHHRRLGVEHFFLYAPAATGSDGLPRGDDGTAGLLAALAGSGVVTWIATAVAPEVDPSALAHGHALQMLADVLDFRWLLLGAPDEFACPDAAHPALPALLAPVPGRPFDVLALPALSFGPAGRVAATAAPEGLVTERLDRRLPEPDGTARLLLRPAPFLHVSDGEPVAPPGIAWSARTPDGAPVAPGRPLRIAAPDPAGSVVALCRRRSVEDMVLALWREGREAHLPRLDRAAVAGLLELHAAAWMVPDRRLVDAAPQTRRELDRLLALPGVAAAQEAAAQALIADLVVLRRLLREAPRFRIPGSVEARLLSLLLEESATASPGRAAAAAPEAGAGVFRLSTCNGSLLHVDLVEGRLVAAFEATADHVPALLQVVPSRPALLLVSAGTEEPAPFVLRPGGMRAPAHLLEVGWTTDGRLTLCDLPSARFASAAPDSTPDHPAPVPLDRDTAAEWESFVPAPVSDIFVPRAARDRLERLDALLATGPSNEAVLALVDDGPAFAADALNAALPLIPAASLGELAQAVCGDALHGRRLLASFPGDPWAAVALPALVSPAEPPARGRGRLREVLSGRPAAPAPRPAHRVLGASLDLLAEAGREGAFSSFPHALAVGARALVRPGRTLCLVATVRDEGPYLLEWLAHHRLLGVEAFFLYGHGNDDGSDALLAALAAAGVLVWLDDRAGPGVSPRAKAYGHAFGVLPDVLDFAWALVIDADEFAVVDPDRFDGLPAFLRWQERREVDAVALNRLVFGSTEPARGADWADTPVTRRCRRLLDARHLGEGGRLVKTISRPARMVHATAYAPVTDERRMLALRTAAGEPHRFHHPAPGFPPDPAFADVLRPEAAAVCHYPQGSAEEWLLKRGRGAEPGQVPGIEDVQTFMAQHAARDVGADDRVLRCAPGLEEEIARLRALPGVAAAEAGVRAAVRARLARLRDEAARAGWDGEARGLLDLLGLVPVEA